jgi:acetyl-CoA acetyltransferase
VIYTTTLAIVLTIGCTSEEADTGPFDCLSLGGGFEGADFDRLEEVCLSGGATQSDADEFIESDAARCVAAMGYWDESRSTTVGASLGWSSYSRLILWTILDLDGGTDHTTAVDAVTGELLWIDAV